MIKRIRKDIWIYAQIALGVCAYIFIKRYAFGGQCPIYYVFDVPCAGCGMTRAVVLLLQGRIASSFGENPFLLPILAFLAYCFVFRYILGRKIRYWLPILLILASAMLIYNGFRIAGYLL